jgi:hypothetical protein
MASPPPRRSVRDRASPVLAGLWPEATLDSVIVTQEESGQQRRGRAKSAYDHLFRGYLLRFLNFFLNLCRRSLLRPALVTLVAAHTPIRVGPARMPRLGRRAAIPRGRVWAATGRMWRRGTMERRDGGVCGGGGSSSSSSAALAAAAINRSSGGRKTRRWPDHKAHRVTGLGKGE